ncbi:septation protein A [Thiofaba sp. EF100]|jgi:intracellular septation protein|uniref:septation protein A n=1 Tax=Thiofaba sp. EF100 TaxID=3121274 RepID=UPI00322215E6
MKLLFDFLPILLFFVAYKTAGIYVATAVAIAATLLQVGFTWWRSRRLEPMHLISLGLIVVFGGATLWLQNPLFIMWKPTILYLLFAVAFLGSQFVGQKPLVQRMMGGMLAAPDKVWRQVNAAWAIFFLGLAVLNLYVAYHFSEETWVNFKLFGLLGLTLVFMIGQGLWLAKHAEALPEPPAEKG